MAYWRYHWHFYFWFHKFPRQDVVQRAQRGHYLFHIFVVYDEDDSRWVHDTLQPMLEETWGLRVCIHARDFDPGRQDLANINEYLPGSHTILAVFSPSFARDRRRQFELGLCCDQALETFCTLVPVLLPGWKTHITKDMLTVLRLADMYLEWKEEAEDPEGHRFFWRILHQVLKEVILLAEKDRQKKGQ